MGFQPISANMFVCIVAALLVNHQHIRTFAADKGCFAYHVTLPEGARPSSGRITITIAPRGCREVCRPGTEERLTLNSMFEGGFIAMSFVFVSCETRLVRRIHSPGNTLLEPGA